MPKQTKVCRVCGKTYESCRSIKNGSGVFNWREMCCSPECGQTYFKRVQEARNPAPKPKDRKVHTRRETAIRQAPVPSETVSAVKHDIQPVEPEVDVSAEN